MSEKQSYPGKSRYFAGGSVAADFSRRPRPTGGKAPISEPCGSIRRGGGKQPTGPGPKGCDEGTGVLEYWSIGVLGCWGVGRPQTDQWSILWLMSTLPNVRDPLEGHTT